MSGLKNHERYPCFWAKAIRGAQFFRECLDANAPRVAEMRTQQPSSMIKAWLGSDTQIVQPFNFGERYRKRTHLWLKELPPLMATYVNPNPEYFVNIRKGSKESCEDSYLPGAGKGVAKNSHRTEPLLARYGSGDGEAVARLHTDGLPCDESVQVAASFVFPTGKVPIPGPSSQNQRRGHVVPASIRCTAFH